MRFVAAVGLAGLMLMVPMTAQEPTDIDPDDPHDHLLGLISARQTSPDGITVTLTGRVKNLTDRPLRNLQAVVTTPIEENASGSFDLLVGETGIFPGVSYTNHPSITMQNDVLLSFRFTDGTPIAFEDCTIDISPCEIEEPAPVPALPVVGSALLGLLMLVCGLRTRKRLKRTN